MARFRQGRSSALAFATTVFVNLLVAPLAPAQSLYDRPILIVDPGMHTAVIWAAAVDAAGRFVATGSDDKTVRIWSLSDGKLLQTIRVPAGPGDIGKIRGVAISPDADIVAAGGWGEGPGIAPIY